MEKFICQYCGKICKNKNSLINHERLCKMNPNHQISPFIELNKKRSLCIISGENQYTKAKKLGLPQPKLSDESLYRIGSINRGKHHTIEQNKKISDSRKKYLDEHPDKVPFKLNHSSKISYPEQYFIDLFKQKNIPLKYHKQVSRYELDFYNDDLKKYVEIDGEQHYSDYMIQHDLERTEFLKNLGWEGIRIRWSEYKKMNEIEKKNKIQEIINFLKY